MAGMFDRLQQEISHQDKVAGLSTVDLLDMEPGTREIVQLLVRRGELSLDAIAEALGQAGANLEALTARLAAIADEGYLLRRERDGTSYYHTAFGRRRRQAVPLDIWDMLAERAEDGSEAAEAGADSAEGRP